MNEPLSADPPKPAKKRNATATRQLLLDCAGKEFQRFGYESASTRRIAEAASCNVALINRYFGSKAGLFEAVMEACIDLTALAGLAQDRMVPRLADIALEKAREPETFDPMVVAIRSSGAPEVKDIIQEHLGDPMVEDLATLIGGPDARQKAGLILSLISGLYVGRVSIGAQALAGEHDAVLRELMSKAIRAILSSGGGNET